MGMTFIGLERWNREKAIAYMLENTGMTETATSSKPRASATASAVV